MDQDNLKILAVHRYYWPDTAPYASILRSIVFQWAKDGHQVDILSSQPSYQRNSSVEQQPKSDIVDFCHVERLSLPNEAGKPFIRIMNALRLSIKLAQKILLGQYDLVMICTIPPIIGGFTAAICSNITNTRLIYHCMDIHPEVGRLSGEFDNSILYNFLLAIDSWTCKQAQPVIVLSNDMKHTLQQRKGGDEFQIEVINNFCIPCQEKISEYIPFDIDFSQFTVLFAGNIGRFQGLEHIIRAFGDIQHRDDIQLILMGDGTAKDELQILADTLGGNIKFIGHHPVNVAKAVIRKASVGFISLKPEVYKYAYPSKTMTYLSQGCPLLAAIEPDSQLAQEIHRENLGFQVSNTNVNELSNKICELVDVNAEKLAAMRASALSKFESDFSDTVVLKKWSKLLKN